ncbi:MAG: hypothetical protein ACI9H8_002120 [Lysobacterales bacterium]|jgi:hypothetical protein
MAKMVKMKSVQSWQSPIPALAILAFVAFFSATCYAESGNYRIEVLIFNHLDSTAEPLHLDEIRSFNEFPQAGESLAKPAPMHLDVMSDVMQETMRRLRLSANFHPLLFASWEQSRIDYHPPVRLHDEELIAEQLHFPYQVAFVDLREMDIFEDYLAPYYRLDGVVQLQRTRFLHLNLDLEFRQDLLPRPAGTENTGIEEEIDIVKSMAGISIPVDSNQDDAGLLNFGLAPSPGPALVHALKQSRQIRIDRMQYFDSPFLSALVRVTATSGL